METQQIPPKKNKNKGQSLVEMAILFPLLIFIFIGLVEVGWAVRGYLTLVSAVREAARYGIREKILSDSIQEDVGFDKIIQVYENVTGEVLPDLELRNNPNATLKLTYMRIDTGYPCNPDTGCLLKCEDYSPIQYYYQDDSVLTPLLMPKWTIGIGKDNQSNIDWNQFISDRIQENNYFNCKKWKIRQDLDILYEPSQNYILVVEGWYDQKQILGFPIISNYIMDPIHLYTWTMMRHGITESNQ